MVARSGTYVVRKELGSPEPCGIYIAGYFNETIIVDVSRVDVTRDNNGVVAVSWYLCFSISTNVWNEENPVKLIWPAYFSSKVKIF